MAIGGRAGEVFTEINVTPLTDVFLVLLVIMILIAPLVNQTVLKVEPPAKNGPSHPPPPKDEPHVDVNVAANGQITVNKQVVPSDEMSIMAAIKAEQTKAGKEDIPLNLQSDAEAQQKYVVMVMDAAAGLKIKQLRVLPLKN
ncbi:MAG TPA: biopolymer transporter ExbD [Planktothrix sp.]|jgi:biopolymer transport protein ExbD/biopolymer transport protein TolR